MPVIVPAVVQAGFVKSPLVLSITVVFVIAPLVIKDKSSFSRANNPPPSSNTLY